MERTCAHIDLDDGARSPAGALQTSPLTLLRRSLEAPFNHFPRVETQSVCRRSDHGSDRLLLHSRRSEARERRSRRRKLFRYYHLPQPVRWSRVMSITA